MKDSILNTTVSRFGSYMDTNPKPVNLLQFITSDEFAGQINELRQFDDKAKRDAIKKNLPAITPSGQFTRRKEDGLIRHSGFIQVDIDAKDNPVIFDGCETLADYLETLNMVKAELSKLKNIAFCGLSASGRGLWALIPIAHPERHKEHFNAIAADFERIGIIIDKAPSNVASLRGYSYDPAAYFNHNAETYTRLAAPEKNPPASPRQPANHSYPAGNEAEKVNFILSQIASSRADITGSYQAWFAIGCALAHEFGQAGRGYFHEVSQYHPEYDYHKADKQFTHCLKGAGYTIATFYDIAAQHGFTYKEAFMGANFDSTGSSAHREAPERSEKPQKAKVLPIQQPASQQAKTARIDSLESDWWHCWYKEDKPEGWDTVGLPEGWVKVNGVLYLIMKRKFWDLTIEPILFNHHSSDEFETPLEKAAFASEFERAVRAREYCPYCEMPEAHLQGCECGNFHENDAEVELSDSHFNSLPDNGNGVYKNGKR